MIKANELRIGNWVLSEEGNMWAVTAKDIYMNYRKQYAQTIFTSLQKTLHPFRSHLKYWRSVKEKVNGGNGYYWKSLYQLN